ncbi:MAG: chain length-determining protein [Armatimonadetes bacterium]|jgi:uncharacterized protein involved in exopolysaccharide biosynthesis|nr:chain length-determining protein [Armatimonadota bacterium]
MHDLSTIQYRITDSFFRHRVLFFLVAALVTASAVAVICIRGTGGYTAGGSIWASPDDMAQSLGRDPRRNDWMTLAQVNTNRFNDMTNDDLPGGFLDRALKRAKLTRPINLDPRARDPRLAMLQKGLSCATRSGEVFAISLTWDNAPECERIVEALREEYLEVSTRKQHAIFKGTREFLDQQIRNYERRMRNAEQALINFKQANLGDSPEAGTAVVRQLAELRRQLDDLTITSRDAGLKREAIRDRIRQIKPTSILEQTVGDDPRVRKIRDLETDRALLLAQYKPGSDEIQAVDTQIAALQQSLAKKDQKPDRNVLETKLQDNPEYQALNQQLTEARIESTTRASQMQLLRQRILDYVDRAEKLPGRQRRLTDRTRNYTILKTQYENLLKQREEAEIQGDLRSITAPRTLDRIGTVVAQWATTKKKLALMVAGSILLGLVLAVLVVILSEWIDPSLRYAEDAERLFGVPALVLLPEVDEHQLSSGWGPALPRPDELSPA